MAEGVPTAVASSTDRADETTGDVHHAEVRRVRRCVMNGSVSEWVVAGLKGRRFSK